MEVNPPFDNEGIPRRKSAAGRPGKAGAYRDKDHREPAERGMSCSVPECPHRQTLRDTLLDTIDALEATRSAFKSKQIEALRKKLIRVLAERT